MTTKFFLLVLDTVGTVGLCLFNVTACILYSFVGRLLPRQIRRAYMGLSVSSMRNLVSAVQVERVVKGGRMWTKVSILSWTFLVGRTLQPGKTKMTPSEVVSSQPTLAEAQACEANEHAAGLVR